MMPVHHRVLLRLFDYPFYAWRHLKRTSCASGLRLLKTRSISDLIFDSVAPQLSKARHHGLVWQSSNSYQQMLRANVFVPMLRGVPVPAEMISTSSLGTCRMSPPHRIPRQRVGGTSFELRRLR